MGSATSSKEFTSERIHFRRSSSYRGWQCAAIWCKRFTKALDYGNRTFTQTSTQGEHGAIQNDQTALIFNQTKIKYEPTSLCYSQAIATHDPFFCDSTLDGLFRRPARRQGKFIAFEQQK